MIKPFCNFLFYFTFETFVHHIEHTKLVHKKKPQLKSFHIEFKSVSSWANITYLDLPNWINKTVGCWVVVLELHSSLAHLALLRPHRGTLRSLFLNTIIIIYSNVQLLSKSLDEKQKTKYLFTPLSVSPSSVFIIIQ